MNETDGQQQLYFFLPFFLTKQSSEDSFTIVKNILISFVHRAHLRQARDNVTSSMHNLPPPPTSLGLLAIVNSNI